LNYANLDWRIYVAAAAALAVIVGAALFQWLRRPADPEEPERRRRARLNQIGRIAEGQVLEIMEVPATQVEPRGLARLARSQPDSSAALDRRKLVCYSYSISGVSYETAQDITGLAQRAGLERLAAGQPASVKYDPVNPSNSILVADDWLGVH
jgi:hypothetical protein